MAEWSHRGFHAQHYWNLLAEAQIELYCGDGPAAWEVLRERWPAFRRSMILRIQMARIEAYHLKARCALAMATTLPPAERAPYLRQADALADRVASERAPWGDALAALTRAGSAAAGGAPDRARKQLQGAALGFAETHMALFEAVTRRREGELRGGPDGLATARAASASMVERGVANPDRMAAMLAPGFPVPAA
jgi:hypothetical protein